MSLDFIKVRVKFNAAESNVYWCCLRCKNKWTTIVTGRRSLLQHRVLPPLFYSNASCIKKGLKESAWN